MNSHNVCWLLFPLSVVCLSGCGTNKFEQEVKIEAAAIKLTEETVSGGYQLVSTKELKEILRSKEDFLLVDAMPAAESYDKGHIAKAINFAFPKESPLWNAGIRRWSKNHPPHNHRARRTDRC